jgi:molybdenum cofactor biosynthesis protein MoaC
MRNISAKADTLRTATAGCTLHAPADCITLLRERRAEKGDALEIGRMAGFLAAKKTWELLPLCHQLPLTAIDIRYELGAAQVDIRVRVETIAGTGVEMEALTAASVTALTIYDLLKPHAEQDAMRITDIRLLEKTGGKSQYARALSPPGRAVILAPSDAVVSGRKRATAAQTVREGLEKAGLAVQTVELMPADAAGLTRRLRHWLGEGVDLIATVGGTGLYPGDHTVEVVRPLLDKELPGIMEAARHYGQRRTPYALISAGIAGITGRTLIVTFPGSTRGAQETLTALMPGLVHAIDGLRKAP